MDLHPEGLTLVVLEDLCPVDSYPAGRRGPVVVLHYRARRVPAACGAPAYVLCAVEVEPELMGISKPPLICRLERVEAHCKMTTFAGR